MAEAGLGSKYYCPGDSVAVETAAVKPKHRNPGADADTCGLYICTLLI